LRQFKVGELKKLREEGMARRRIVQPRSPETAAQHEATQQDEAEVSDEMGAQRDPESGEQVVDERAALKAGAVDAESVVENRRLRSIVNAKRSGKRDIHINVDDVLIKYDQILRVHSADSLYISVKRVSGGPQVQQIVPGFPRSGRELYEEIRIIHGRSDAATYQINFFDSNSKEYRAKGQITMPDARDPRERAAAQGQPMNPYPPQYGYPPGAQPAPGYQPQAPPPQGDIGAMVGAVRQLMEMMQTFGAPPAAPPGAPGDFSGQLDSLRQMLDTIQGQQQGGARPGFRGAAQPQPAMNPQMAAAMAGMGMPPVQAPPGVIWTPLGFVSVDMLMRVIQGGGGPAMGGGPGPAYRGGGGPYRGPYASGAGLGGEEQQRAPYASPYARGPAAQPEAPRTAADQFRDSITLFRTFSNAAKELGSLFGTPQETPEPEIVASEDEASPVRVIDTGHAKLVVNRKDGSLRGLETGFANVGPVLKWIADQVENARKQQQNQQQQRALPEGYVEMTPGYQPPPGYVAVPEEPPPYGAPSPLPPPPSNLPPPLGGFPQRAPAQAAPRPATAPPAAAPRSRTWGPPTIPQ
jgi:hypothetical protein